MTANLPEILALDFDGVICDGLQEYFATAWRTYCEIWSPASKIPPNDLAARFYPLRPVIETGWEMPVLIKALLRGMAATEILQQWNVIASSILQADGLNAADIATKLDQIRDEWIRTDLASWLSLHKFYPGVVEKLHAVTNSSLELFIITTKEGRFVTQLLQQHGLQLSEKNIFGKENKRPKQEILRELIAAAPANAAVSVWFVEDRLKTLQSVQQQPDLAAVQLYLADWGYNTTTERATAQNHPRIKLLSLAQFAEDFTAWR